LFTSPHLHRVGERIRIAGPPLDDAVIQRGVDRVAAIERELNAQLSFFEMLTAIAIDEFVAARCSFVVLEAGLGGRLDSTTALRSSLTLIARIALDHEALLGDTLTAIAGEKAAVIRPSMPVFSLPQEPEVRSVIERVAAERGAPLHFVEPLARAPRGLPGPHQQLNAALALAGLRSLVGDPALGQGLLDDVHWPARLERVEIGAGELWFDVAHNLDGIERMLEALEQPPQVFVFGALVDKHPERLAARLRAVAPLWLVPPRSDHPMDVDALAQPDERRFAGVEDPALHEALVELLQRGGRAIVCGSHYLVGELRARFLAIDQLDPPQLTDPLPRTAGSLPPGLRPG
jgi:dihydrofolate synthase/folylpolyglutamate synthase